MNAAPPTVSLQFNAAACRLAEMLWYARAMAYDLDVRVWSALEPAVKALYVDQAQQILHANRPVTAPVPAVVVGRISPVRQE